MADDGFTVDPDQVNQHVGGMRSTAAEIDELAGQVAGLYPEGGSTWTGSVGADRNLRTCLGELASALRRINGTVVTNANLATTCVTEYVHSDDASAESLRQCLIPAER